MYMFVKKFFWLYSIEEKIVLKMLKKRFKRVSINLQKPQIKTYEFLIKAIDHYGIDTSEIALKNNEKHYSSSASPKVLNLCFHQMHTFGDAQYIILHELRHIMQFISNDLVLVFPFIKFENHYYSSYNEIHLKLPWEIDANLFASTSPLLTEELSYCKIFADSVVEYLKEKI